MKTKTLFLIIVVAAVVGSIWFLEATKVHPVRQTDVVPVAVSPNSSSSSTVAVAGDIQSIALQDQKNGYTPAAELATPTGFINTSAFKLSDLVGKKVILVDFWTYSCINCIRTLPYLKAWYDKYRDVGLEIIGIHTPEFEFEKNYDNVNLAVKKFGIKYPVVLDSNYGTWQAYGNQYWPHEYVIDIAGYVVHDHIGEGGYDETEAEIKTLLDDRAKALGTAMPTSTKDISVPGNDLSGIGSPETYFGSGRNEYLANGKKFTPGEQNLTEPRSFDLNALYLSGTWNFDKEYATNNSAGAKIIYKYNSAKVFFVANAPAGVTIEVVQDGKPLGAAAGGDVINGKAVIKESRLYNLVNNPDGAGEHVLEIIIENSGLNVYTFTFG